MPFLHQQSWGFVLIPLLVKCEKYCSQQDRAEASVKHQAPQEQLLLGMTPFPAAPELEASVAVST